MEMQDIAYEICVIPTADLFKPVETRDEALDRELIITYDEEEWTGAEKNIQSQLLSKDGNLVIKGNLQTSCLKEKSLI